MPNLRGDLRNLLFYSGSALVLTGVILLFVGASILFEPIPCAITGCPSTTIYWGEVYTGMTMTLSGIPMMIASAVMMRLQDFSQSLQKSEHRISGFLRATLLGMTILGVSMFLLGIIFATGRFETTFECSTYLPCWPPPPGPESATLSLLGAFLSLFSVFIWYLRKGSIFSS